MTTNQDEVREEFIKKYSDGEFSIDGISPTTESVDKIADFWLSKFDSLLAKKREEIEKMKKHDPHAEPLGAFEIKPKYDHLDIFGYNQAINDIIKILS